LSIQSVTERKIQLTFVSDLKPLSVQRIRRHFTALPEDLRVLELTDVWISRSGERNPKVLLAVDPERIVWCERLGIRTLAALPFD